ncbi:MAG: DUF892 family protein [Acidobacteria bacterium]|nr:DUF892 family protein [Acidobacteriota bacterium]
MDASPDVLVESIRARRAAIGRDLEWLRVKLEQADPRRWVNPARAARTALPVAGGAAALWLWRHRRGRVRTLHQLLVLGLNDIYRAERDSLPALDSMRARAWNAELAQALAQHRDETEAHVGRLERVFRSVGARPKRGTSASIAAIVAESERVLAGPIDRQVRDAWLIAAAQRIEHLEMAGYGTARAYADTLGFSAAARLLQQTLEEERIADQKLTHLAERFVNRQSMRTAPAV